MNNSSFQKKILSWYQKNKRPFPWRETSDPYRIMVSEFMLQQTQTQRVLPKYKSFINKFPTVSDLAQAPLVEVLQLWQGLGYNRRAKFLHQATQEIYQKHSGTVPCDTESLESLPGIGPYTSKAISTFAFNRPEVFIETNIRTVYLHFFFKDKSEISDKQILEKVAETIEANNPREWYYALMDYGVLLKKTIGNQNKRSKHYAKQSKFKGSNRQIRGQILKVLLEGTQTLKELQLSLDFNPERITYNLDKLVSEKMIFADKNGSYNIPDEK